jgi:hypothetical protein
VADRVVMAAAKIVLEPIFEAEIMALVKQVGTKVTSVSGLYDLHGKASKLASAAE